MKKNMDFSDIEEHKHQNEQHIDKQQHKKEVIRS
jgi:hypothetical protein